MLTPEQFHALKEGRNQLETTYTHLLQYSDILLEKLVFCLSVEIMLKSW